VLYREQDVLAGQQYYFSRGGQHIGSIWGRGSYLAPDWSADYLHSMGLYLAARHLGKSRQEAARFTQADFEALDNPTRARLSAEVAAEAKISRYSAQTDSLVLVRDQAEAHRALVRYYTDLFKKGNEAMGFSPGLFIPTSRVLM
jgi:nitric oxide reductase subunit B